MIQQFLRKRIYNFENLSDHWPRSKNDIDPSPILRIGDQVLRFDVFWPKHLQEVRSTVYIHVQSM